MATDGRTPTLSSTAAAATMRSRVLVGLLAVLLIVIGVYLAFTK